MRKAKTHIVYVCGAGGKTTYIRKRARAEAEKGLAVLVTTTTRMLLEKDTVTDPESAAKALLPGHVVTAGQPDPGNSRKIIGFPPSVLQELIKRADIVLIEADGARHMQMKAPYPHEPVIGSDADEIVVVYGARAEGERIRDVCYNPEGVLAALQSGSPSFSPYGKSLSADSVLTGEDILSVLDKVYVQPLKRKYPDASVTVLRGTERSLHLILLAAGYSRRFAGGNKLLYPVKGKPMYRHIGERLLKIAEQYATARCGAEHADLTVVTQYEEIRQGFSGSCAEVVINPDPLRGISSSLQCALSHLSDSGRIGADDFLVVFSADQPDLGEKTICCFLKALCASGKRLGCVTDGTEMRNPCAFGAEYLEELSCLTGDTGGKKVLKRHAEDVFLFRAEHAEELEDIDCL